jgi:hypothetical protein
VTIPKTRREIPEWVIVVGIITVITGVVGAIVWGVAALIIALTDQEPGPAQVDVSWQCTEFGDRLYWPTDASRHTFAVVPGRCRT